MDSQEERGKKKPIKKVFGADMIFIQAQELKKSHILFSFLSYISTFVVESQAIRGKELDYSRTSIFIF